jgi:hypothetical protein
MMELDAKNFFTDVDSEVGFTRITIFARRKCAAPNLLRPEIAAELCSPGTSRSSYAGPPRVPAHGKFYFPYEMLAGALCQYSQRRQTQMISSLR